VSPSGRWGRLAIGAVSAVGAGAAGAAVVLHLGRTAGSTRAERRRPLPGDELVARPTVVTTHAVTIDAPPEDVWPWLVQMGYHRGGWYTAPWVDRYLFRMRNPSADRVVPELQDLAVGDIVPDGPPGTAWYVVDQIEPERWLVLHSTTHDAPWRGRRGVWVDWTWSFVLEPRAGGSAGDATRLLVRARIGAGPWWLRLVCRYGMVPADLVMSRSQRRGIRRRAERLRRQRTAGAAGLGAGRRARPGRGSPRPTPASPAATTS
jgi:hypothetical protein